MIRTIAALTTAAGLAAVALPVQLHAQSETPEDVVRAAEITVVVDNGNWLDVRVYARSESGSFDRIGTVTSFSTRKLELPRWITSANTEVQLIAAPIGSTQRYAAPPVLVSAGDVIEWKLGNNLASSSIWVRAG